MSTTHFPSLTLHFPSLTLHFILHSLPLTGVHFPNPRFENMQFTVGSTYRPLRELIPVSNGPIPGNH